MLYITDRGKIEKLKIITQPCDKVFVAPGEQAMFTVAAQGTNLRYQWMKYNGEHVCNDDRIRGALSPTCSISKVQQEDDGEYVCEIKGEYDSEPTRSSATQLIISKSQNYLNMQFHTAH